MMRPFRKERLQTRPALLGTAYSVAALITLGLAGPAWAETYAPAVVAVDSLSQADSQARTVAALAQLTLDYETHLRRHDPVTAGLEGDVSALGRLPDISRRAELARRGELQGFVRRAEALNTDHLDHEGKLNLAFILYLTQSEVERITLDTGRLGFDSEGGSARLLNYLANTTRITSLAEGEAWMKRLEASPELMDANAANTRRGLETGLLQARSVVESALVQAQRDLEPAVASDPLYQPFASLPASISETDQARLRQAARDLISGPITQRRQQWLQLLRDDYLPKAPLEPGLTHRPGGRDLYAHLVRYHTTGNLTPEQVHAIGLEEVARIRALMEVEMKAAGWEGSFADFLAFLRTDPQFYATSREQLMAAASEIAQRADAGLSTLFGTLPKLAYEVRPVPTEIEDGYTTGRYQPGSLQNGVPGAYLVNTGQLDQRPLYELPALTVHEAVPGHHLQIALQQEASTQAYYRRSVMPTAFVEGWGLYAEYLGEEMGIYRTPYERFGRLSYEMWRACRLVADTGLHWYGWSEEQARACFRDNSALSPHNIETELQRYISDPGQATAYKIGEIHLKGLRQRVESELGDRFDLRRFHDELLTGGALPLYLLDININVWLSAQKADSPAKSQP